MKWKSAYKRRREQARSARAHLVQEEPCEVCGGDVAREPTGDFCTRCGRKREFYYEKESRPGHWRTEIKS